MSVSAGSNKGARYRTSSGTVIANQGEQRIAMSTDAGQVRIMTFQIVDVTKPPASVGHLGQADRLQGEASQEGSRLCAAGPHHAGEDMAKEASDRAIDLGMRGESGFTRQEDSGRT